MNVYFSEIMGLLVYISTVYILSIIQLKVIKQEFSCS